MRFFAHILIAVITAAGAPVRAGDLPPAIGYTLYMDGVRVGHSAMKIRPAAGVLVFESKTRVQLGPNEIDLTSRTEADPKTFEVRRFSFKGTKAGMPVAANVTLRGDSATGWIQNTESGERQPRSQHFQGGFQPFEDWVMDLEVLLALRQGAAARNPGTYRVLFPNSFLPADLTAGFTGEASVEAESRSMVARKLEIYMVGAKPFFSHVDPASGIPVYIHFPGTRAEAFRDDFFGENPVSRYPAPRAGTPDSD